MGRPRTDKIEDWDQFTVRLPPGMRDKLKEVAQQNGRSANAEIVARLERTLDPAQSPEVAAMQKAFKEELDKAVRLILEAL